MMNYIYNSKIKSKMPKEMTQSQINELLKQSDFQQSEMKGSEIQISHLKNSNNVQKAEQSNEYGADSFEQYQQSKSIARNKPQTQHVSYNLKQKSLVGGQSSYGNEQFQSYQQSRRTKEFHRSSNADNNNRGDRKDAFTKQSQINENNKLQSIKEYNKNNSNSKQKINKSSNDGIYKKGHTSTASQAFNKKQTQPIIQKTFNFKQISTNEQQNNFKSKSKSKISQIKQNKHLPYKFDKLQQRQRELLFTTLSQQNKRIKQALAQKDKQTNALKMKYNILLEEKAQTNNNAKQATLLKKLSVLQQKYDAIAKQKTQQRAHKTFSGNLMGKTVQMISEQEVNEREEELLSVIDKLKERLISSDKQLKTLQNKMNQGLDYQQQLQRKLKRVEQLDLKLQKMKDQAEQDRGLIEILKEKTAEQKKIIENLREQKNQLIVCLKRAQMSQITQSDILDQLKEVKRQKQLLEESLKEMTSNFSRNLPNKSKPQSSNFQSIEDSNQFLSHKR